VRLAPCTPRSSALTTLILLNFRRIDGHLGSSLSEDSDSTCQVNRLFGQVRPSTHMDGNRVNRDLTSTIATVPRLHTRESAMRTRRLRHFFIGVVALAAALLWSVVLERSWAAVSAWYKFTDYGGGGHIVVGRLDQAVFLLGSCVFACIGYALSRAKSTAVGAGVQGKLARLAWSAIAVCILLWFVLLLTPLVTFTGSWS
jgi:hypothetical protein